MCYVHNQATVRYCQLLFEYWSSGSRLKMAPIEEIKETEKCRDIDIDQLRDKIMQDLRSAFPDIDFRIQSSPSYLTTHCATTQQSIFCFQKVLMRILFETKKS